MSDFLLFASGIALLIIANILYQRQRERTLMERLNSAGNDPDAASKVMDIAIAEEKKREEFWYHQNPKGPKP